MPSSACSSIMHCGHQVPSGKTVIISTSPASSEAQRHDPALLVAQFEIGKRLVGLQHAWFDRFYMFRQSMLLVGAKGRQLEQ